MAYSMSSYDPDAAAAAKGLASAGALAALWKAGGARSVAAAGGGMRGTTSASQGSRSACGTGGCGQPLDGLPGTAEAAGTAGEAAGTAGGRGSQSSAQHAGRPAPARPRLLGSGALRRVGAQQRAKQAGRLGVKPHHPDLEATGAGAGLVLHRAEVVEHLQLAGQVLLWAGRESQGGDQ